MLSIAAMQRAGFYYRPFQDFQLCMRRWAPCWYRASELQYYEADFRDEGGIVAGFACHHDGEQNGSPRFTALSDLTISLLTGLA